MWIEDIEAAIDYAKKEKPNVYNWNETLKKYTVVAFGLGKFFEDTHNRLFDMCEIAYVSDNNYAKWGGVQSPYGKKYIKPEEIPNLTNPFVIAVVGNYIPIREQMRAMQIPVLHISEMHFSNYIRGTKTDWLEKEIPNIKDALKLFTDDRSRDIFTNIFCNKIYGSKSKADYETFASDGEYFRNGNWALDEKECFVDGGAYTGDTIIDFIKLTKGSFDTIYSFEYEKSNYKILCKNVEKFPKELQKKIETFQCGIWDKKEIGWCEYLGESDGTQLMEEHNKGPEAEQCVLDRLDNMLDGKKVTIIKLDIEGAEPQGLIGAGNIIKRQKPKLAICLYHSPEDLWRIPLLIHSIRPDYKMTIRHHSYSNYTDTVLYAK